jgi:four helix bundle protein
MTESELLARTKRFALRVMKLVDALPSTSVGRAIGNQLIRSGTSVGANYRAACKGRSRAEFAAKLGVVEEDADECVFWMEPIIEGNLLSSTKVEPLRIEAREIVAIMAASRRSGRRNSASIANRKSQIANPQ